MKVVITVIAAAGLALVACSSGGGGFSEEDCNTASAAYISAYEECTNTDWTGSDDVYGCAAIKTAVDASPSSYSSCDWSGWLDALGAAECNSSSHTIEFDGSSTFPTYDCT